MNARNEILFIYINVKAGVHFYVKWMLLKNDILRIKWPISLICE